MIWATLLILLGVIADPPESPAASLRRVIAELRGEITVTKDDGALPRGRPDFAGASGVTLPPALVAEAVTRPHDRDPIVDAYVRWQLTGFLTDPPDWSERDFERVLARLPRLVPSPHADPAWIRTLTGLGRLDALTEAQQGEVEQRLRTVETAARRALELNRAALGLRERLLELAPRDDRVLMLELERVGALVETGWPCDRELRSAERRFAEVGARSTIDARSRRALAAAAGRLAGRRRAFATAALRNGVVEVRYDETAIDDFVLRRWMRELEEESD